MFSPEELKQKISEDLSTDISVPPGHKVAIVSIINGDKAEIALAAKFNEHWQVKLLESHEWTGNNEIGFISKVTW